MRKWLYILAALLLLPALLTHLGLMVFIDDEAIRSLVAREMQWSGNYIAPTMHGDAYLNKPPLWNWLLAVSFILHGEASEWAARLPTVICLLGFAATTYFFSRRHFSRYLAIIHALTVITCGRMLFWDSMLALIDVCFSWVIYTQIMLLYHFGRKDQWWQAFGWTYLLCAVAFMLKGLPAIVFQGINVLAILYWRRAWWQFVRPAHLVSGIGCLALLTLYYYQYSQYIDLTAVAERLFVESSKRTAVAHGWGETAAHIASFPFEMSYHFLPWTLLLVYLLQPGSWRQLRTNDFAAFCLLVFLVNLPVYWLSPNVYPRYLLMLFPLLFASLLWLHQLHASDGSHTYKALRYLLLSIMSVAAVLTFFIPLVPQTGIVDWAWPKAFLLGGAAGALAVVGWRRERDFLLVVCCFLLLLRLIFNVFILPPRAVSDVRGQAVRRTAYSVAATANDRELAVFHYTLIEPATGFYLTQARGGIVPRHFDRYGDSTLYVGSPSQYPTLRVASVDSLYLRHLDASYPVGVVRPPYPVKSIDPGDLRDGMGSGLPID